MEHNLKVYLKIPQNSNFTSAHSDFYISSLLYLIWTIHVCTPYKRRNLLWIKFLILQGTEDVTSQSTNFEIPEVEGSIYKPIHSSPSLALQQ